MKSGFECTLIKVSGFTEFKKPVPHNTYSNAFKYCFFFDRFPYIMRAKKNNGILLFHK